MKRNKGSKPALLAFSLVVGLSTLYGSNEIQFQDRSTFNRYTENGDSKRFEGQTYKAALLDSVVMKRRGPNLELHTRENGVMAEDDLNNVTQVGSQRREFTPSDLPDLNRKSLRAQYGGQGNSLDQALPGFAKSCVVLYGLLLPWGLALLVMAFAFEFWHGPPHPGELLKFMVKLFLVVLLLAKSHDLINDGQDLVQAFVKNNIPASPEKVAERYKQKLAEAQNAPELKDQSFLSQLFSSDFFEAIIFAFLTLLSWLAMALVFFMYSIQRAGLLLSWAMSPLLFPLLAIRPLSNLGMRHLLRTGALIFWPLSLALAATCTEGLLDVATDKDFLSGYSAVGSLGRGLISMLSVTVITVWILFSTIAAPVYIQRLIAGGDGPTNILTKSADLITSIGLPSYFGVPRAAGGARRASGAIMGWAERVWQWAGSSRTSGSGTETTTPVLPSLPITPTQPEAVSTWKPTPDDPTGDRFARSIVKQAKTK